MYRLYQSRLLIFIFLVAAVVAAGCAREPEPPALTATPSIGPLATDPDAQGPGPAVTTPTDARPTASPPQTTGEEGPRESPIRVISARSASAAPRAFLLGAGNASPLFAPQRVGGQTDLTVSVNGTVTVAADEAYVVIIPAQVYGPSGPQPISSRNRTDVIARLTELGIAEEDIEIESRERYGPPTVSVEVEIQELPEIGDQVLDAVEEVLGRSENQGVRFSLSAEQCDQAMSLARREAIPQALKTADDLAEALGVTRGSVIGAVEYPLAGLGYGPVSIEACGSQFVDPFLLSPFDAEPRLEVSVGLQVTYAIEP